MIKLREIRKKNKLSQSELAKKMNMGQTTISHYELGSRKLNSDQIIEFVKVLNCTADELLGLANEINFDKKKKKD